MKQRIRIGIDPHRDGPAPAGLAKRQVPFRWEADSAVVGEHVHDLEGAAVNALALRNAEHVFVEALVENEWAFFRIARACGQPKVTRAEVAAHCVVEGCVQRDGLAKAIPVVIGGIERKSHR